MRRSWIALFAFLLLLPSAAYAQDGRPTKPPPGQPTEVAPAQEEQVAEGSASQLYADVQPQLGMQLLSSVDEPYYFDGYPLAGGDKYIDVGGDCIDGYTAPVAALGIVWSADSGPVSLTFYPDETGDASAFLIWEMAANQWWCNTDFFETPVYEFDNMGMGVYFVWLMMPEPTVASGWLDVMMTEE